jgi:xanthine dehydrogenase YagR molybdenum-binding subunit
MASSAASAWRCSKSVSVTTATGRVVNANLEQYMAPVKTDVPALDVFFVIEEDKHVKPLGAKGLAELSLVGVAPAIANAVYHATGKRVRDLPIRPDKLL